MVVDRLCTSVAGMAASMSGLDALVFTGASARHLVFPHVDVDAEKVQPLCRLAPNGGGVLAHVNISSDQASVRTLVITAREDIEMAREVRRILGSKSP